ncbi:ArnT family glycosyltransferase [Paraburkholderia gardini]|uniref:Glycosyltransferase RgtA/B/C/D-like domain-containing protein n=1 Tax=Paraburkholderia gardini TaxID=2823469 RepID=A0ABN7QF15_9BURK|nr:glycosyltransferase family 39 protein [Paraburkholderia gardini]CAG4885553.1 hypothetical protein R54767_00034 [Paraburkholderia gardini]
MSNNVNLEGHPVMKVSADDGEPTEAMLGLRGQGAALALLSFVLWAVVSLPTILFSRWFPLDMGGLFYIGDHLQSWLHWIISPYNGSGRYFPFYWLYHALQFQIFGANVAPYFFIQSVLFLAATLLTCKLVYRLTGSRGHAAALVVLIYISSPIAENLNTIGKAEPLSYFFIACIVFIFYRAQVARSRISVSNGLFMMLLFALAIWTKETSAVLLGFAATGIILSLVVYFLSKDRYYIRMASVYATLLGYLSLSAACTKIPYVIFNKTISSTSYTEYQITAKLVRENIYFYVTQQPDVLFFGLLSLGLLAWAFYKVFTSRPSLREAEMRSLVMVTSICAMAWAYYLALMIWRWPMGYYMLIPAVLFKFSAVYGMFAFKKRSQRNALVIKSAYTAVIAFGIYGALTTYYIAFSQIAYSRIYTEAILKYKNIQKSDEKLIIESYPFYAEQIGGTANLLSLDDPYSSRVKGIADLLDPAAINPELLKILNVSKVDLDNNIHSLPKKNDYLLVFTGDKLATWFLRGVTPYFTKDSLLKQQKEYDMELVDEDSISNPALFINTWTNRPNTRQTYVGYKLYRVLENEPKFLWSGRYPDGWIGTHASLKVNRAYTHPIVIRVSAPPFTLPNKITITKDGKPLQVVELTDTNEKSIELRAAPAGMDIFDFAVQRAVSPKTLKINDDKRELGVRITLEDTSISVDSKR